MSYSDEAIKRAADALRKEYLDSYDEKLKPTHAHELVAAYSGYKSKIALKSDAPLFLYDPEDPDTFPEPDNPDSYYNLDSEKKVQKRITQLNGVDDSFASFVVEIINTSLKPECSICGKFKDSITAVEMSTVKSESDLEQIWACDTCIDEEEEIGFCIYCGDHIPYHVDELNDAGECEEHAGESYLSPQEEEDWDSYIENITKNG